MTSAEFRAIADGASKGSPRLRSKRTVVGDEVFQSKHEADRWSELQLEERAGAITDLDRQRPFAIVVNRIHVCDYVADFVYRRNGREVVEDAKAKAETAKARRATRTESYRLKKKLMRAVYGIKVLET
jgi:hypothetical protein